MTDEFETLYTALQTNDPSHTDEVAYKNRLKTLNRLRAHLTQEVELVRSTTVSQLGNVTHGKRGLKAYRAIVQDGNRGAKRGEG